MSTEPQDAAIGEDDAAGGGDSPLQYAGVSESELADLAAAIDWVEGLLAAGALQELYTFAAVERIADIAFKLHERGVEPLLRDALDAAVREINDSDTLAPPSAEWPQRAAGLLHQAARRTRSHD